MRRLRKGLQCVKNRELNFPGIKSVVVLGDNGCRPPTKEGIVAFSRILKIKTDLFIIVGDIVLNGEDKQFRKLFKFFKGKTKAPIYALGGNHDLPGYAKFCGRSTYAIILDKFGFICLDDSKRKFEKKDVVFLERELKKHKEKKFFVLFHIPPPLKFNQSHIEYAEWEKVRKVLDKYRKRIVCIFCGHIHAFLDYLLDGYRIFISGGGGATLFNLKEDHLKAHHALRLSSLDEGKVKLNIIPVKKKIREVKIVSGGKNRRKT